MTEAVRKPFQFHVYLALARLFRELDLDPDQPDIQERAAQARATLTRGISQEAIMHFIGSNTTMTKRVIEELVAQGLATSERIEGRYDIRITVGGAEFFAKSHALYSQIFQRELRAHFRYSAPP